MHGDRFLEAPPEPSENVLEEIPKDDITYISISNRLIPHSRLPDTYLLEYLTFTGHKAFQPCSLKIDLFGLFDALKPIEKNGDITFKIARNWSCIVQAVRDLPKDVRWILATIYNFSSQMLQPGRDEDELWGMRAWLHHWYYVADMLFNHYGVFATTPEVDWFLRPTGVTAQESDEKDCVAVFSQCKTSTCASTDNETIICKYSRKLKANSYRKVDPTRNITNRPLVQSWLDSLPTGQEVDGTNIFDPTAGPPTNGSSMALRERTHTASTSTLNPLAAVFRPQYEL